MCALMLSEKFWMIFPGIYEIAAFCYFTGVRNSGECKTRDDLSISKILSSKKNVGFSNLSCFQEMKPMQIHAHSSNA